MVSHPALLAPEIWRYIQDNAVSELPSLAELRAETSRLSEGGWQIPPEQGQFLGFLIELLGIRQVLEIGTFTGYGTLCMAKALPEDGIIVTIEGHPPFAEIGQKYWRSENLHTKVDLRLGMALDVLAALENETGQEPFDMVFIDADKKEYEAYFEHAYNLVRPGGLIAIDNILWRGAVADADNQKNSTNAIRRLTRKLRDDERVSASLVPIGDGLLLVRRR